MNNNKNQKALIRDLMIMRDHIMRYPQHLAMTSSSCCVEASNTKRSEKLVVLFPYTILLTRINNEIEAAKTSLGRNKNVGTFSSLRRRHGGHYCTRLLRKILLISFTDVPMMLLFTLLMLTVVVQFYYNHYISPTIDAARWIHDDASRLQDEFTYYARECDVTDVTTDSIRNVILQETSSIDDDYKEALQVIMTHGMAIVPSLIGLKTSEELRNYIMKRNLELTADEVIPLDTPQNRWSFGIHANEHPSVANALSQISSNVLLENILSNLLGMDPAVAEITAISVAPGAEAQGWHSDVKQLGNSVKYAQTFTHSYSLFIPLQDVTNAMGATELCPGTHYCADDDLHDVCVEKGFQAAGDTEEDVWKAGDGLLMNQKMWHRGAAYTAKSGPHRVVFIITFISRPNFGVDHRQLSHGTYFHIHPHMYGHTWNDLKNTQIVMTWPFAPLRSLGIWKPPNANWGWDWVTTSATRIANDQNGYMFEDLLDFVEVHSIGQTIPSWLHGSTTEEGGWQMYFKETIENFVWFGTAIYFVMFLVLMSVTLVIDLFEEFHKHRTKSYIKRILCLNAIILVITHQVVMKLESTQYATSVREKTIFARPFVAKSDGKSNYNLRGDIIPITLGKNETVGHRFTTVPEKNDVLLGSRFDSNSIGYYRNFLNYHPGNIRWRDLIATYSDLYTSYCGLPSTFQSHIRSIVENEIHQKGRILIQNYYGEWIILTEEDVKDEVLHSIEIGIDTIHAALYKEIDVLSAATKHGLFTRGSPPLQIAALRKLGDLKHALRPRHSCGEQTSRNLYNGSLLKRKMLGSSFSFPKVRFHLQTSPICHKCEQEKRSFFPHISGIETHPNAGDVVLANFRGSGYFLPCKVLYTEYNDYGVVEFKLGIGQYEHGGGERSHVYLKKTKPFKGFKQSDNIAILNRECKRCPITFENATLGTCFPDLSCEAIDVHGRMNIVFKDEFALRT